MCVVDHVIRDPTKPFDGPWSCLAARAHHDQHGVLGCLCQDVGGPALDDHRLNVKAGIAVTHALGDLIETLAGLDEEFQLILGDEGRRHLTIGSSGQRNQGGKPVEKVALLSQHVRSEPGPDRN